MYIYIPKYDLLGLRYVAHMHVLGAITIVIEQATDELFLWEDHFSTLSIP